MTLQSVYSFVFVCINTQWRAFGTAHLPVGQVTLLLWIQITRWKHRLALGRRNQRRNY